MKKLKRICGTSALTLSLLFTLNQSFSQTISPHYFGENAWMPDTIGDANNCTDPPCIFYGKLHKQWKNIKDSKAVLIRYGGIATDKNMPTNYQYIRIIDSVRAYGMEPIIQVPFHNWRYSAQQAADIVTYINVTKGKNVKYWIIANEPDLGYSYSSASQIAAYFKPFASAMKNADPSILIIGPELAWFNKPIIDGLTTPGGANDITGKDPAGRYYLDVISFHTYPFNGSQARADVISNLTSANHLQDNLIYLNGRVASCNSYHNRTGNARLKTAITEANVNWQNNPSDNLNGVGANSFIGGQFVAEMLCVGMKNGLDFINIWSVVEGNNTTTNIGYIDPGTGNKKPLYYHYKMLAENFRGTFADGITNQANVKSYGCTNGQEVSVLIMNQELSANYNYNVRLNSTPIPGTIPLKINIDAGIAADYTDILASQSSVLLTFNSAGTIVRKTEYSLTGNALASQPPAVTEFISTGIAGSSNENGPFEIKNVFPNPTAGKFTIQLNKENTSAKDFNIQIYNIIGQQVYNKNLFFQSGKEEIELEPSVASGQYIVRIKEQDKDNYLVKKLILQK